MSAEERTAASEKGFENGRGDMSAEERMAANEKGYENGLWAMSAEARMSASEQGCENGLGALSAKERTAAIAKGLESKSNTWEENYAVLDQYDGIPGCKSALYTWQRDQLKGFVGRTEKEIATNGESTVWSDGREKLEACIVRKKSKPIKPIKPIKGL